MALTQVDQGLLGSYAQYTGFKNRIINGAMMIDQRNAGAEISPAVTGSYYLDRWVTSLSVSGKFKIGRNAGSVTPPAGFTNYLGITSLSAYSVLASDFYIISQVIEGFNVADLGFGTANASSITLSFRVYSSLTGTFGGSLNNGSDNRCYPFTYSIPSANTWTTVSVTIPGDTAGTWATNNTAGMIVRFGLGVGSTYSGTAGAWSGSTFFSATGATSVVGTNGATFYITGVQLEKGSTATSFDYRPYGTELALCQRYYETLLVSSGAMSLTSGYITVSNNGAAWYFKQQKRATPTVALTSTGSWTSSTPTISPTVTQCDFWASGFFLLTGTTQTPGVYASSEL